MSRTTNAEGYPSPGYGTYLHPIAYLLTFAHDCAQLGRQRQYSMTDLKKSWRTAALDSPRSRIFTPESFLLWRWSTKPLRRRLNLPPRSEHFPGRCWRVEPGRWAVFWAPVITPVDRHQMFIAGQLKTRGLFAKSGLAQSWQILAGCAVELLSAVYRGSVVRWRAEECKVK